MTEELNEDLVFAEILQRILERRGLSQFLKDLSLACWSAHTEDRMPAVTEELGVVAATVDDLEADLDAGVLLEADKDEEPKGP